MIRSIRFSPDLLEKSGLRTTELTGLGPVVVLAGPNGGGKTRYLKLIREQVGRPTHFVVPGQEELDPGGVVWSEPPIDSDPRFPGGRPWPLFYESSKPYFEDPSDLSLSVSLKQLQGRSYAPGGNRMQAQLRVAADAYSRIANDERLHDDLKKAAKLDALTALSHDLLGQTFGATTDEVSRESFPALGGRPLDPAELSEGQKALLFWMGVLLSTHAQGRVIIIDEPEGHVHPDTCWRLVEALRRHVGPKGQLWVATHSLPLIAQLDLEGLHYVENGEITRATRTPSKVWQSLLGGDDAKQKLLEFLDGDGGLAAVRFARECLMPAGVVGAQEKGDPQAAQLVDAMRAWLADGKSVRILDVGAGKGRLVAAISDLVRETPGLPTDQFAYVAYNDSRFTESDEGAACGREVLTLKALGVQASYCDDLARVQARAETRGDVVVMANFLHEVPVDEWLSLFKTLGACARSGAVALVIEDQEPRVGEQPHPRGFLILEHWEWEALVGCQVAERRDQHNGRDLTAFTIPIARLAAVGAESLGRTLPMVSTRCVNEVKKLRDKPADDHRAGRKHAFYAMMHLNATLAASVYPAPPPAPASRRRHRDTF